MNVVWPRVPMGEIAPLVRRPIDPKADGTYREIGIRSFGKGVFHKPPTTGLEIGDKRVFAIEPGDLLFNIVFAWEGAVAVASDTEQGMIGSHRFLTCVVDKDRADARFLNYWFRRGKGRDQLLWASPGGAGRNRTLGIQKLAAIRIPLPPLQQQNLIIQRVEHLSAKVHEATRLRALSLHQAQSLIPQLLAQVFACEAPRVYLGDQGVCTIICGQHLNPEEQASAGVPYITGPADFTHRTAVPSRFALNARACSETGDILLTVKGAGVGKTNLAPKMRTALGRQLFALRPNPARLDSIYLWYVIQHSLRHFREAITATTVPGIGRADVERLAIPLPSLAEQCRIASELESLQGKVESLMSLQRETAAELAAMLPAILDKAFKGEL